MDKLGPTGLRLGRRLNELRRERGYTLGELETKLAEVGRPILLSALSKIEKGQRRVDADDLVALARALEVSPNSLLLPSHMTLDAEVELTPSTILDIGTAWGWAIQDGPLPRTRRGIFISYSIDDAAWATWISWQLANAGYEIALDSWDLTPGADIRSYITDSINRAACVITVISESYKQSDQGAIELTLALNREQIRVLPVIIDGSASLDGPLADRKWIRLDNSAENQAKLILLSAVNQLGIRSFPVDQSPPFPTVVDDGDSGRAESDIGSVALPAYRAIVALDIEGSSNGTNRLQAQVRHVMYDLLETALRGSGITDRFRDRTVDRGDGMLVLIRPVDQAPKALLLNSVIPILSRLLTDHNTHYPDHQFRLRAVVHAGEVHYDSRGCFGEALDIAFRLLNATQAKGKLRQKTAPLMLVVSDGIYQSVIRHRYHGIDENSFEPLVRVRHAGQWHRGWVHVPGSVQPQDLQDRINQG